MPNTLLQGIKLRSIVYRNIF